MGRLRRFTHNDMFILYWDLIDKSAFVCFNS